MTAERIPRHRLRVLVMTSTFPRWAGDTEPRFVLDLCRHLAKEADVLVLAPHAPGASLAEQIEGVHVRRFRYFIPRWQSVTYEGGILQRLRRNPWRLLQLPCFLLSLLCTALRCIWTWSPDVIHAHWIIPQGVVACLAAKLGSVPVVCTSHGSDLNRLPGRIFRRIKAWTLATSKAITVVGESMVEKVDSVVPHANAAVIPMGTDLSGLFVPPAANADREKDLVLFVGRLVPEKGVEHLLEAIAAIAPGRPSLRLMIAGCGPSESALRERSDALGLGDRVMYLGGVSHAELPALYQKAAVAVFPFAGQEGFPLVVVEAIGCGCPVIVSDLRAVRATVQHGVTGVLVRPGDVTSLAGAMRSVLNDTDKSKQIADRALAHVRTRFDWSAIAPRYLDLLMQAALQR